MQAIKTKFLAPTNHREPRIVAECARGRIVCNLSDIDQHDTCRDETHRAAVNALLSMFASEDSKAYGCTIEEAHWLRNTELHTGQLKDGDYVHVIA